MGIKVVFFDCDGTLTAVKSSWQYLHERLGLWDDHAEEFQELFREGKIDYAEFCRRDARLWIGLPVDRVMQVIDEIPYHEGVRETVQSLHDDGIETAILSTGLAFLVEKVKKDLGIDIALSNELVTVDGFLSGGIKINVGHDNKGYWVKKILRSKGLKKSEAAAVGDGEGDRGMFESVGLAIGYHPSDRIVPLLDYALYKGSFKEILDVVRGHR